MSTVGDKVEEVRSMLRGSLTDELSVLADDYTAGVDDRITLQYAKPNLQAGVTLSVGLNTFYGHQVLASGSTIVVQPSIDGGPNVDAPIGTVVRIKPAHTTWAIYREWCSELDALSSPEVGLYSYESFQAYPDYKSNTYDLPLTVPDPVTGLPIPNPPWSDSLPIRLLQCRYQVRGFDSWQKVSGVEWQAENQVIRVYGATPNATTLRFIFAFPFKQPTDLTDTLTSLGVDALIDDIPGLGVAFRLAISDEARRNQIYAQGDARRPTEVPSGAQGNVARLYQAKYQQRVAQEAARRQALFGYQQMVGVSGE